MSNFASVVAKRIRELREARGFSVRELGRRARLPPESISRSERGITEITLTSLARVCAGLEVTLPEFFGSLPPSKTIDATSSAAIRVLRMLERLPGDRQEQVARALELLLADGDKKRRGRPSSARKLA
jgi:transcriptional regulator with XRE-family HTH domain